MNLTVEDIINAQIRSYKNLDESKNCSTCLHSDKLEEQEPCNKCINSFIGIVFTPSNWKEK
jgi:hypothetical protein